MNAFDVMRETIRNDPNASVEVIYRPKSGEAIPCRANYVEPDITVPLQTGKVRDRKRYLSVSQNDVPVVANGDVVEIPVGGPLHNVVDFACKDPLRLDWQITVAPQ